MVIEANIITAAIDVRIPLILQVSLKRMVLSFGTTGLKGD
jgi:hypothetical protein